MGGKTPDNKLSSLAGKPGIPPELLELESLLLSWRESVISSIADTYPGDIAAGTELAEGIAKGQSLTKMIDVLPEPEMLNQHVTEFLARVIELLPTVKPLENWLKGFENSEARDQGLSKFFTAAWRGDLDSLSILAKEMELDTEILSWTGRQICKPFFHQLATLLAAHPAFKDRNANTMGCPCCGGAPRMGRYDREEGRRFLWCDLCNIQWQFTRIVCPFCGNRSHEKLGYLTVEGSTEHRIDVCETCKSYLRTFVERDRLEGDRVDFQIEDVSMLHLCFVAEQQDYQPGVLSCCTGECACGAGSNEPDAV